MGPPRAQQKLQFRVYGLGCRPNPERKAPHPWSGLVLRVPKPTVLHDEVGAALSSAHTPGTFPEQLQTPQQPIIFPSFHFIFHFIFHLIFHYPNITPTLNPKPYILSTLRGL